MTIQVTLHLSLLLHQKERWEAKTSTRLPKNQRHNHMQPISTAPHLRPHMGPQ